MTPALTRLLHRATFTWFAVVTYAAFCTARGKTSPGLWILPCVIVTGFLAVAVVLADRAGRKQAADQEAS